MSDQISEKLKKELENGIVIAYRVKNHRLDYSIMNRPEPQLSGIDDHALATALIVAGKTFKLVVDDKVMPKAESIARADGRTVSYNEGIDIDFEDGVIRSSRTKEMTLVALEGVIVDLMRNAKKPTQVGEVVVSPVGEAPTGVGRLHSSKAN